MEAVLDSGAICQAAICYTGDILNPQRPKYDLKYYVQLAKQLEQLGLTCWRSRTWPACSPTAARTLVRALRQEVGIPIHFHTRHGRISRLDSGRRRGGLGCCRWGTSSMSGGTSQVNLNTLVEAAAVWAASQPAVDRRAHPIIQLLEGGPRVLPAVRKRSGAAASGDLYEHEMPGGRHTNLYHQRIR